MVIYPEKQKHNEAGHVWSELIFPIEEQAVLIKFLEETHQTSIFQDVDLQ